MELSDVTDEFYDLMGKVEYGDVTDLDTSWSTIINAIRKLRFKQAMVFPSLPKKHQMKALLEFLKPYCDFKPMDDLIVKIDKLEEALDLRSHDSIEDEDLEQAKELASECEEIFISFIEDGLSQIVEDE